jgi:dolichol-phosphate mannosyltransferase
MSGFFAVSRERYVDVADEVNPRGFKILLEFVARGPRPRVAEVGYDFRERVSGESNLTSSVIGAYLVAIIDLFIGRIVSATFTAYALVGLLGVAVRFVVLLVLTAAGFGWAAFAAFQISVVSNYVFNNSFTFAPQQRRGARAWTGFVPFQLVALHGLMVQAGVAAFAGYEPSDFPTASIGIQIIGIVLATTGNYHLNRNITWRP